MNIQTITQIAGIYNYGFPVQTVYREYDNPIKQEPKKIKPIQPTEKPNSSRDVIKRTIDILI